ncbi:MAG: AAA family ATPase [bacterium]|nr:AAA family ATPase [bacterium]
MKKLPVGISDFKDVIEEDYYFIDKTLFIKEIIDNSAKVLLVPRPRRFGKTINLSMLRYFYEKTEKNNKHLFEKLAIWQQQEEYTSKQGKYPVIFLTFKDIKSQEWADCLQLIKSTVADEFKRHSYLLEGDILEEWDKKLFKDIIYLEAEKNDYIKSLSFLSRILEKYYNKKVVILIDEYDTPIQAGYINNFYGEIADFMRGFLGSGLKDNSSLEKSVVTGIMRVARESIFSGLNNLGVFTLLSEEFSDKFGFTDPELKKMLQDFNISNKYNDVRFWYNGYIFGQETVYNPWSIINFISSKSKELIPYWINTSDNKIIEILLSTGGKELKEEIDILIRGECIEKPIDESIVFSDIEKKDELIWSFLLFGGYLKQTNQRVVNKERVYSLSIPNEEVSYIYTKVVKSYFTDKIENKRIEVMLNALINGDIELFELLLKELVLKMFSYHDFGDESERVYQSFVIGLFVWLAESHEVTSNRESGYGRYDVMIIPKDTTKVAYVIEFKKIGVFGSETIEEALASAFKQIEEKKYETELTGKGITNYKKLAIVFKGKEVTVREQGNDTSSTRK